MGLVLPYHAEDEIAFLSPVTRSDIHIVLRKILNLLSSNSYYPWRPALIKSSIMWESLFC